MWYDRNTSGISGKFRDVSNISVVCALYYNRRKPKIQVCVWGKIIVSNPSSKCPGEEPLLFGWENKLAVRPPPQTQSPRPPHRWQRDPSGNYCVTTEPDSSRHLFMHHFFSVSLNQIFWLHLYPEVKCSDLCQIKYVTCLQVLRSKVSI